MKPSILVVMLDFLVCSLLLFVIGTGGSQTQFATSAPPAVHEEFSAAALQQQQEEWNRDYEQQTLLTRLQNEAAEKEQLQTRLAAREATLTSLAEEKASVERAKAQTEAALTNVVTELGRVSEERERLQKEGEAAKERVAQLQTQQAQLQQQALQLGQTVASQQATISTLGQEVRASQVRMEAQLAEVTGGQQAIQQELAAQTETLKDLQSNLSPEERAKLLQAIGDVAKGQEELQSQLGGLIKSGQGEIGQSLTSIQAGQAALQEQAAKLGEQIESIKARGPGPFKAVKLARLQLLVKLERRDIQQNFTTSFKATAYPPVVNIDGHSYVIADSQQLGFHWWGVSPSALQQGEVTDISYDIRRSGETNWAGALTSPACILAADPHTVAIELADTVPGLQTMELAGPDAALQTDQRKLNIFKSSAAGLSFEVDAAPDLSDPRYIVVKRPLRGVAAWFENPAYRADAGDYMVTGDGKFVGIMVSRDRCFVLDKEAIQKCAASIPLISARQFQTALALAPRAK
jgi:predicted nuclease with TOPRIM domain